MVAAISHKSFVWLHCKSTIIFKIYYLVPPALFNQCWQRLTRPTHEEILRKIQINFRDRQQEFLRSCAPSPVFALCRCRLCKTNLISAFEIVITKVAVRMKKKTCYEEHGLSSSWFALWLHTSNQCMLQINRDDACKSQVLLSVLSKDFVGGGRWGGTYHRELPSVQLSDEVHVQHDPSGWKKINGIFSFKAENSTCKWYNCSAKVIRITEPYDLFHDGSWSRWGNRCAWQNGEQPSVQHSPEKYFKNACNHCDFEFAKTCQIDCRLKNIPTPVGVVFPQRDGITLVIKGRGRRETPPDISQLQWLWKDIQAKALFENSQVKNERNYLQIKNTVRPPSP